MKFDWMSDSIRLHDQPLHYPWDDGDGSSYGTKFSPARLHHLATDGHGDAGGSSFGSPSHASVTSLDSTGDGGGSLHGNADVHQPNKAQADQLGGNGGGDNAAGGGIPAHQSNSGKSDIGTIDTGANEAGNGGDGFFYGGIIHASLVIYQPINIAVSVGYGSIAIAEQTNDVNINQSALQMAGIGGHGGDGNIAAGGNVDLSSSGSGGITTGDNHAGNGGDGHFLGTLLDAPVVIYHPVNFAFAAPGGSAHASQSNTVEIDQSALQIAGIGGQGGNGNAASGGDVSVHSQSSGGGSGANQIDTGGNQAGNGGDGQFHGDLVHKSVAVYDPVNISVAGYNSTSQVYQLNDVHLDQSSFQMAGVGGDGGSGNVAAGGSAGIISALLGGGSDAIATGHNSAGNGGSGHFSGSLIDVSVAIYAPINIAIAGPHSTAEADQINNVHIDQSTVQIAGIGGNGGHDNLALGGDVAMHLLSDLHLIG
ncbi:hypothetical protein AAFX91_37120 [Bradyrhizobium sp. 31Argb]|uniref:hypothetical protein n=1 Tax=unclassified Bradyrhizobium TaxID=2631580 RepID=UPI00102E50D1|nr:hypothetical protein [Bradyrhizobium sp. Leo170]TAI65343.1 hypothetical protein CWO89_14140 [Bradyrhizobium sp. Leo170]